MSLRLLSTVDRAGARGVFSHGLPGDVPGVGFAIKTAAGGMLAPPPKIQEAT